MNNPSGPPLPAPGVHLIPPLIFDPLQETILSSDRATTLLERDRYLKHMTIPQAAKALGVSVDRYNALESGCAIGPVTMREKVAISKFCVGLTPAQALGPCNPDTIAATAGRF
jgi:hypothetical protein